MNFSRVERSHRYNLTPQNAKESSKKNFASLGMIIMMGTHIAEEKEHISYEAGRSGSGEIKTNIGFSEGQHSCPWWRGVPS
jgi:hypothetical protein